MKKPTIRELMRIGMYGFCIACIGGAIAVVADLNGQLYWARFGFVIVILGMIIGGAVVVFGFFMNLANAVLGGIESFRFLHARGLTATIEEAKRRYRDVQ